jgi:hypothetical protein
MDLNKFLPDSNAIRKTDWSKPDLNFDTKDPFRLIAAGGALLMIIFVFLPWCTYEINAFSASRIGITTWYGIFGFLLAVVALGGVLYNHYSLTFTAAVVGIIVAIIGMTVVPTIIMHGKPYTGSVIQALIADMEYKAARFGSRNFDVPTLSHTGAILYLVATLVAGVGAYLKMTKK